MLTQLPLLGFPGSLTIFLLSPISSWCKCSNRGDGEMQRGGEGRGRRRDGESICSGVRVGGEGQRGDRAALTVRGSRLS